MQINWGQVIENTGVNIWTLFYGQIKANKNDVVTWSPVMYGGKCMKQTKPKIILPTIKHSSQSILLLLSFAVIDQQK